MADEGKKKPKRLPLPHGRWTKPRHKSDATEDEDPSWHNVVRAYEDSRDELP